jgi:predicted ATP-dependent endonuclease of OLD family
MITRVIINNFKKLENVTFPVSQSLVIIGPNNSGKSTIFQALCLWEIGVRNYLLSKQKNDLDKRGFAVINRKDLLNSPISDARFLWRNKAVTEHLQTIKTRHIKFSNNILPPQPPLTYNPSHP